MKGDACKNLFKPLVKGYYLYADTRRHGKWIAWRKYPDGRQCSKAFYSPEDGEAWLRTLMPVSP